jgi:hypothetical protein
VRELIVTLRKQNLSIYDISRALKEKGEKRSPVAVSLDPQGKRLRAAATTPG